MDRGGKNDSDEDETKELMSSESDDEERCITEVLMCSLNLNMLLYTSRNSSPVSIYKVPSKLRKLNEAAYTPRLVSIGPIHHGKPELQAMQKFKWRFLDRYLQVGSTSTKDVLIHTAKGMENQTVGRRLIFKKGKQNLDVETDERRKKIRKFKESAWKCVYYLSAEILALTVTYNEPWFTNTSNFWLGPGDQVWPDQKMKLKLKGVYMYAGGFYTYSIFALIFWETRRSDFGVSMGHHVATAILIGLSYILRFARVGSVVLALHDASDVFLEVGKMSKYSGAEALASFSFIIFVLSWIILRLIYYPFWILWSTSYEVVQTLDKEKHKVEGPILYYVFNSLLFCLLVLHVYWWVLMYRMLVKQIQARGQLSDDVRSDSDSDNEHED